MGSALTSTITKEPLLLMHFMIFNVTARTHKKIKISTMIISLMLTFCQIVSFFSMTKFQVVRLFLASVYFYFFISLICLTFIMDIESLTKSKRKNCWQFDRAGLEVKQGIFRLTRKIEAFLLVAFVILFLFLIRFLDIPEFLHTGDYSVILINQYVPYLEPIYRIFIISFIVLNIPISVSWILHFTYFGWHIQLQVFMLTKFVRGLGVNVVEDFYMTHSGVVFDGYYQRCIWKDLHFLIKRHTELLSYHREVMQYLRISITSLLLGISGTFLCLSGMWTAILEHQARAGLLVVFCFIVIEILSFTAQAHEDRFLAIFYLALEAPWYKWDIKNRKAYLLLIQQSAQVVSFSFFNSRANREFQAELLPTIYSIGSILVNLNF